MFLAVCRRPALHCDWLVSCGKRVHQAQWRLSLCVVMAACQYVVSPGGGGGGGRRGRAGFWFTACFVTHSLNFVNGSVRFHVSTNSQVRQLEEQLRIMDQTLKALMAAEEKVLVLIYTSCLCRERPDVGATQVFRLFSPHLLGHALRQ